MSLENKNNDVGVLQFSHNEKGINSARVASVGCEQNHGEKKVLKCGYKNCVTACVNGIKFNNDEQVGAKVQNASTAKLCVWEFVACANNFCRRCRYFAA